MNYIIGLDMGIASVGYAAMMLDEKDQPCRILRMGTRIFDAAEHPKDGSSLAAPRRESRSMRRRLRRKRHRKERIRALLVKSGIMSFEEIEAIYHSQKVLTDIYQIRAEALDRRLDPEEFVRLLIHLSQRRGFKSNRKTDGAEKGSEAGKLLTAVTANRQLMQSKGYRTIGEMLYRDEKFAVYKRNKADDYSNTFDRSEYVEEIKKIFHAQQAFGNPAATDALQDGYIALYCSQRSFDEGPGKGSPYGGNQIEKMIGTCTLEPEEKRCPKAAFSFEYFNLLTKVNNIRILSPGGDRKLSDEERRRIIALAFSKNTLHYYALRKELGLNDTERFHISYGNGEKPFEETEKKTKFSFLPAFHTFCGEKGYGAAFRDWPAEKKNRLAYALTAYKNDKSIRDFLSGEGFTEAEIEVALNLPSFTKWGNLSEKALNRLIPYLEKGMLYHEACKEAGYDFQAAETDRRMYLPAHEKEAPELEDIQNPVVRRAISQTIKVINALVREMGESPCFVNLELARELSKNKADRDKIEKGQKENQARNESLMEELKTTFHMLNPSGQDLIKLKLWREQDGICPYSGQHIPIERLFEPGYTDIDHILPYSISFDDTYANKVLVMSSENRQKSNRLPMQYLTGKRRDDFQVWVANSRLSPRKKRNLTKEQLTESDLSGFKDRNLQDTQYLSSFMLKYLKKYLLLAPNATGQKTTVRALNGAATAYLRKRWGIQKIRDNGDTHHAVDAVVIGCATQGMIKRISDYARRKETAYQKPETGEYFEIDKSTGEVINRFPMPYPCFRDELIMRCAENPSFVLHEKPLPNYATDEEVAPIFVSRMPRHKATGAAHDATARKPYEKDGQQYTVSKVALTALKLKDIENYFKWESDTLLYQALKERLTAFGGNAAKAFAEPFYKPKSDGSRGPLVKKVKIMEKSTLTVPVLQNTAVAKNDSMIRVDVFFVEGKGYYLVPIYVADTVKADLPNKAIKGGKAYALWEEMREEDFVFSLYPNDVIKITSSKEMKFLNVNPNSTLPNSVTRKEAFVYYKGTDISTASITAITHDHTYQMRGLGVQRLKAIEKYTVDVLGNLSKTGKEKRMRF